MLEQLVNEAKSYGELGKMTATMLSVKNRGKGHATPGFMRTLTIPLKGQMRLKHHVTFRGTTDEEILRGLIERAKEIVGDREEALSYVE